MQQPNNFTIIQSFAGKIITTGKTKGRENNKYNLVKNTDNEQFYVMFCLDGKEFYYAADGNGVCKFGSGARIRVEHAPDHLHQADQEERFSAGPLSGIGGDLHHPDAGHFDRSAVGACHCTAPSGVA